MRFNHCAWVAALVLAGRPASGGTPGPSPSQPPHHNTTASVVAVDTSSPVPAGTSSAASTGTSSPAQVVEPLPPLPQERVQQALSQLKKAEAMKDLDARLLFVAGLVGELEAGRVPQGVTKALATVASEKVDAEERGKILMRAMWASEPLQAAWDVACDLAPFDQGLRVFSVAGIFSIRPRMKVKIVYGECYLAERGLVKPSELTEDYGFIFMAHGLEAYLKMRTNLTDVEARALAMLAKGGSPPAKPFTEADFTARKKISVLAAKQLVVLRSRIEEAITLLHANNAKGFITEIVHPADRPSDPEQLAHEIESFGGSGRLKDYLDAFTKARRKPAAGDDRGNAMIFIGYSDAEFAIMRLQFKLHKGKWYLVLKGL